MRQPITVSVTQDDIDKGVPGDSLKCPIACALGRRFEAVEVCEHFLVFHEGGFRWFTSLVPLEVVRFITSFDEKEPVAPFEFTATFFQQESVQPVVV